MDEREGTPGTPEIKGTLLVLLSATGFGALAILAKLAYEAGLSALVALNWRFILAALFLTAYVALARLPWRMTAREAAALLLLGGVGYAAMSALFFAALRFIPASAASLLLYTYPAFVTLLSRLFWQTPLTSGHLMALLLTGAGTVVLLWSPGLHLNPLGTLLGLGAAVVYSFYLLANQRVTPRVNPAVAATCIIGGAGLSFTVVNLASGAFTARFALQGWTALALMALFSTALAIATLLAGIRRVGAARASILSTFEPLVTVALAVLFLHERLGIGQVAGGLFIAAGMLLLQWPAAQRRLASSVATRSSGCG